MVLGVVMKIVTTLLIAFLVLPLCISISIGTSYIAEPKELIPQDSHVSINFVYYNLSTEPAMMILIGTCLITIAEIGRKKLSKKDNDHKIQQKLKPAMPPYPDPVPWKKEIKT
jgi:hypothetical protein